MTPKLTLARCAVSLAVVLLFATPSAWAFRCNSYIIDVGMHKTEVMKKCGAPASRDSRIERRVVRARSGRPQAGGSVEVEREQQINIEEWVYNFGPSQFMQLVVFENGQVVDVKDLGYGS